MKTWKRNWRKIIHRLEKFVSGNTTTPACSGLWSVWAAQFIVSIERNEIYTCWMCIFLWSRKKKSWGDFHFQGIELQTSVVVSRQSSMAQPHPSESCGYVHVDVADRLPFSMVFLFSRLCCVERCNNDAIESDVMLCRYCVVPLIIADDFMYFFRTSESISFSREIIFHRIRDVNRLKLKPEQIAWNFEVSFFSLSAHSCYLLASMSTIMSLLAS